MTYDEIKQRVDEIKMEYDHYGDISDTEWLISTIRNFVGRKCETCKYLIEVNGPGNMVCDHWDVGQQFPCFVPKNPDKFSCSCWEGK